MRNVRKKIMHSIYLEKVMYSIYAENGINFILIKIILN